MTSLFLARFKQTTTTSPGDDGMRKHRPEDMIRLVEAENEAEAEAKIRARFEEYVPYDIHRDVTDLEISEVIR